MHCFGDNEDIGRRTRKLARIRRREMRRRREVGYGFKRRRTSDIKDSGAAGPSPAVTVPYN
jgi:hypothetical protein